eukprot:4242365-Pyramimonas_sp.AAC.1
MGEGTPESAADVCVVRGGRWRRSALYRGCVWPRKAPGASRPMGAAATDGARVEARDLAQTAVQACARSPVRGLERTRSCASSPSAYGA